MDPLTGAVASAASKAVDATGAEAAKTASSLLTRLLGPSADVIGQDWADRLRQKNLKRLLEKTQKRAEAEADPGFTKPRLAAATFEAAQYADDEIVAEYLSGVLASSRAPGGGTDSGLPWSAVIARLSSDQLRLHFLVYASSRSALISHGYESVTKVHTEHVMLPIIPLMAGMGLRSGHKADYLRLNSALQGLMREGLIGDSYVYGTLALIEKQATSKARKHRLVAPFDIGLRIQLTIHGVNLFLWGLGHGAGDAEDYLNESVELVLVDEEPGLKAIQDAAVYEDLWVPREQDESAS